jgi:hypothetical protein
VTFRQKSQTFRSKEICVFSKFQLSHTQLRYTMVKNLFGRLFDCNPWGRLSWKIFTLFLWPLCITNSMVWVRERPLLVGEVIANVCWYRVRRGQRDGSLRPYSMFSRQEPLLFYQVAPHLYSRGWVDPVPDPLLFFWQCRESIPGLRICSQKLWPPDHRGGRPLCIIAIISLVNICLYYMRK